MRLSQFANGSFVLFCVFVGGVAFVPVVGKGNRPRFVLGVGRKGFVGLAW